MIKFCTVTNWRLDGWIESMFVCLCYYFKDCVTGFTTTILKTLKTLILHNEVV